MTYRQCKQMKCSFNMFGGCHSCPECNAAPNEVTDKDLCISCYSCEGDEGILRWNSESMKQDAKQSEKEKEVELEIER